jgi:hypothetical protein
VSATADPTLAALARQAAHDVSRLVGDHLTLARLELRQEARVAAGRLGGVAVAAALFAVAWGCGAVALALLLAPRLGAPGAFGVVAGGHAVVSFAALAIATRRSEAAPLAETRLALEQTRARLAPKETP